jgi:uncharacterized membrane protein HdeD (DUF308 family)
MSRSGSTQLRTLAIVMLVIGVILIAIGVVYFTVPAAKLPSFLGTLPRIQAHRTKRGGAALLLGGLSAIGGVIAFVRSR